MVVERFDGMGFNSGKEEQREEKSGVENLRPRILARISVSLPANLLKMFCDILEGNGYSSMSEGVRDAIRVYIAFHKKLDGLGSNNRVVIPIICVYDYREKGVSDLFLDKCARYKEVVSSVARCQVDKSTILAVIIAKGQAVKIKKLIKEIMSVRGVKRVSFELVTEAERI